MFVSNSPWSDYLSWPDDERWEIIAGEAYAMSPSPGFRHQDVLSELTGLMRRQFKDGECQAFVAPLDVRLSDCDVVQPDLLVVCDPRQLMETHVEGAPSLVVEVLSPSTEAKDRGSKLELYARSGVSEYWIVNPFPSYVEVLVLDAGYYKIWRTFGCGDTLKSVRFPKLRIPLRTVFDFPLALAEKESLRIREPRAAYKAGKRNTD